MHVQFDNSCKKRAKMHFQFRNLLKKKAKIKKKQIFLDFFRFYIPCTFFLSSKFVQKRQKCQKKQTNFFKLKTVYAKKKSKILSQKNRQKKRCKKRCINVGVFHFYQNSFLPKFS